jgi:hypothetical protein
MNNARRTRGTDAARALRAQRGAAAAVAQYIHELSARHRGSQSDPAGDAKNGATAREAQAPAR